MIDSLMRRYPRAHHLPSLRAIQVSWHFDHAHRIRRVEIETLHEPLLSNRVTERQRENLNRVQSEDFPRRGLVAKMKDILERDRLAIEPILDGSRYLVALLLNEVVVDRLDLHRVSAPVPFDDASEEVAAQCQGPNELNPPVAPADLRIGTLQQRRCRQELGVAPLGAIPKFDGKPCDGIRKKSHAHVDR